jgi:hypothetical protein
MISMAPAHSPRAEIEQKLAIPNSQRIFYLRYMPASGGHVDRRRFTTSPPSIPGFCFS